jgi:hypothetical protein
VSTTLDQPTIQQRASAATAQLRQALGLDDLKLLSAAVAEAAAVEAARNAEFFARIRRIYEELASMRVRQPRWRASNRPKTQLVPLPGTEGARFDPFAPLDPYLLLRLYGPRQLRAALSAYSYATLREAVAQVQQKNPGTRPKDRRKTESLIEYIVEHLEQTNK